MDNRFSKQYRLLKTEEFSSVFALRKQRQTAFLQVLHSHHNPFGHPRLGLVVSKKTAKRANKRNYMKRVIRDWFRRHRSQLPPHDYVVQVRRLFTRDNAPEARDQLAQLMMRKRR